MKPLDDCSGYTMTSNPPMIGRKDTDEVYQLSSAQVLALQGFDPRTYYVPKHIATNRSRCLIGFANMVPLQLSIAVWRALVYGVQEMVHPEDNEVKYDVYVNCGQQTSAEKKFQAEKTKRLVYRAESLGTRKLCGDQALVWLEEQKPETPGYGRTWRQIPLDPYAVMRHKDQLNEVIVGCDARNHDGTAVQGGYFCRLRSALAEKSCSPEDVPCMSGWCVNRSSAWCEEEGTFFCERHLAMALENASRHWRTGRGNKREHRHCTLCGGEEPFPEKTPRLSNIMKEERTREMAVIEMHACDDKKCHRAICKTCLFARWGNAARLRCERLGFLCHVHERGKAFAENSDKLRLQRIEREMRASQREDARGVADRLASAPITRARSERSGGGRGKGRR